jgi:nitrite reductase/ring-hydroxylating ferredoxin subunit
MKTEIKWHKIFDSMEEATEAIPLNSLYSVRIDIKKICISHTKRGLSAMEDACPHKLVPLTKGYINEFDEIVCQWHKYCFDTHTGYELTGKNIRPVRIYPIEEREDGIYIGVPTRVQKTDEFSY